MMPGRNLACGGLVVLLSLAVFASASGYQLESWVLDATGTKGSGLTAPSGRNLTTAVGQPGVIGRSYGASYKLNAGFLHPVIIVGIELPKKPTLLLPRQFRLFQNIPNPFIRHTQIRYELPIASHIKLAVYDVAGREVRTLVDGTEPAGFYKVAWDGRDDEGHLAPSGVYFLRFQAGSFKSIKKMVALR